MKLDDILADLEKKAGDESQEPKKDESKEKENPFAKKDEKDEKKGDEAKKEGDQEKTAAFKAGADLAREVMEKVASQKLENTQSIKGEEMNKQASDAGIALAQALLKQANVGDVPTQNGIMSGVVPNKTQVDLAQQKAEHDAVFQATPGTDGLGNGGTINQIFDAIVSDAMSRTGAKDDNQTGGYAAAEGVTRPAQTPAQVGVLGPEALHGDTHEKVAAVVALVDSGFEFDDAVNLVKAAADELEYEHGEQVKQAAFNELIEAGVDFDSAVSMIKEAGKVEAAKAALKGAAGKASGAYNSAATKANAKIQGATGADSWSSLYNAAANKANAKIQSVTGAKSWGELGSNAKNHVMSHKGAYAAGAGVAAAGAGAYALGREKKAALDMLIDNGVDFDTAVGLVDAKAAELYGN